MRTVAIIALCSTALSIALGITAVILLFIIRRDPDDKISTMSTTAGFLGIGGLILLAFASILTFIILPVMK